MQVANNARAIENYLEKRYEQAIDAVAQTAREEADELSESYAQQAKKLEAAILVAAKQAASTQRTQDVAAAQTQARKNEQDTLATLAQEVCDIIAAKYLDQSSADKQSFVAGVRRDIEEEIRSRGYEVDDFRFDEDAKQLSVQAHTDDILIEDGLQQRLAKHKTAIIEHIKEHVQ